VRALLGSLAFFTTLPLGAEEREFREFISNLWLMPISGFFVGALISLIVLFFIKAGLKELSFVAYIAIEGINHIDGLADFSDSLFAPKDRKLKALKDRESGVGAVVVVTIYLITIFYLFSKMPANNLFIAIILSQVIAKQVMFHLILRLNPLWSGLAETFKEGVKSRDKISYILTLSIFILAFIFGYKRSITSLILVAIFTLLFEYYIRKIYGGINGDIIGASNCITFVLSMVTWL